MTSNKTIGNDDSNSKLPRRTRSLVWYAMAGLLVIAILLMNNDGTIVDSNSPVEGEIIMEHGMVGVMTPNTPKPIQQISILGERNSGTRWLYSHIGDCFNQTLGVKRYLTRYKHWFQHKNATKYPHDTLVIAQFRNPYDWFEAMRNVPHHSPEHIELKWKEFLTKPWTMDRIGLDLNLTDDAVCQEDFKFRDIRSCVLEPLPKEKYKKLRYSENQPFYEMKQDGSGKPFANIMEMRSAKIRNFLDIRQHVGIADVWTVQYEFLLSKGTDHLLEKIEEWTGVKRTCKAYPAQLRRKRPLSRTFARFLNKELDWSAEGLIGYTQEIVQ